MSRSRWTVKVAALLTLLLPGIALGAELSDAQAEPGRPNVVLVVVDDLDIGPLRRYPESFPNLNGLAQSGVSFDDAFVTDPLCCPSRATILTGRYSHNHGIWRNVPPNGGWPLFEPQEEQALPVWVDAAQYATGYTGRYLNRWDGSQVPPGWDEWHGRVLLNSTSPPSVQGFRFNGRNEEGRTHTQVFADEAVSFIQRHAGEPFFLFVAPYAPHEPAAHPSAYEGLFAGERAPRIQRSMRRTSRTSLLG
jgi:N-acetylglucosamine-6-sulfatase